MLDAKIYLINTSSWCNNYQKQPIPVSEEISQPSFLPKVTQSSYFKKLSYEYSTFILNHTLAHMGISMAQPGPVPVLPPR